MNVDRKAILAALDRLEADAKAAVTAQHGEDPGIAYAGAFGRLGMAVELEVEHIRALLGGEERSR
jgi:hypothetical protein